MRIRRQTIAIFAPAPLIIGTLVLFILVQARYGKAQEAQTSFLSFLDSMDQAGYPAAQRQIEMAVSLDPGNADYLAHSALLHERLIEKPFEINVLFEKKLDLSGEQTQHVRTAIDLYQRALLLNPTDDGFMHNLGWLYQLLGDRQSAIDYFKRAIAANGYVALYHISLGLLREQGGERAEAEREYRTALRLSPAILDSPFFLDLQKRAPEESENLVNGGIADLEELVRKTNSPILKAKLGRLYIFRQPQRAVETLQQAAAALPNLPRVWLGLGSVYELMGKDDEAQKSYQKAVFLDEYDVSAWYRLANFLDRHGNNEEAILLYKQAIQNWVYQSSGHADRSFVIYKAKGSVPDDIIPNGLLTYTNPAFDVFGTCKKISSFYQEKGNQKIANRFEEIGDRYKNYGEKFSPVLIRK